VRRFSETRRPHPLAPGRSVSEGIREERGRMIAIRDMADAIVDTSDMTVHELRQFFMGLSRDRSSARLVITLLSFGFKHGVPLDADLVFDVRCLPNPHYEPELAAKSGVDPDVIDYLQRQPESERMYSDIYHFVASWLPDYARDNRNYLTVAIGCTGGRHRSVYLVERLAKAFAGRYQVLTRHREFDDLTESRLP